MTDFRRASLLMVRPIRSHALANVGALESSLKVGTPFKQLLTEAVAKMDRIMAEYRFTDPKIKEAATRFVNGYRNSRARSFGTVGIAVHDVSNPPGEPLQPGVVFSIEPAFKIPDEIYIRIENTYVVTPNGVKNLSPRRPSIRTRSRSSCDSGGPPRGCREPTEPAPRPLGRRSTR